jgi:hypothetical protein
VLGWVGLGRWRGEKGCRFTSHVTEESVVASGIYKEKGRSKSTRKGVEMGC